MCIGGVPQKITLDNGRQIYHCQKYEYLDMNLTNDRTIDTSMKDGNVQEIKSISMVNGYRGSSNMENKQRVCNTIIKSIIIYKSEVEQMKQKSENIHIIWRNPFLQKWISGESLQTYPEGNMYAMREFGK